MIFALGLVTGACAQPYPAKPVRLIIASAAGGGIDLLARIMAPKFSEFMGQPVIVDNRPGAGSSIGAGIVATPDNLGLSGAKPTHPELLEWLAAELVDSGWSVKAVHKKILASLAFQQSAAPHARGLERDPANQFLWRFPLRRLLDDLRTEWGERAVELVNTASGWRFQTRADFRKFADKLNPEKAPRYSRAVMETLFSLGIAAAFALSVAVAIGGLHLAGLLLAGTNLVVHCAAGIGRAGTTATGILMLLDMEMFDAIDRVRAHRPMAGPESGAQRILIEQLDVHLNGGDSILD